MAKFCSSCGKEVEETAKACPNCGAPQEGPATQTVVTPPAGGEAKSKMAAGLLQIFLGGFGVGRFYLGYTGIGIAQIAVTWLTCGLGGIWPLIDGIMILTGSVQTDAKGVPLKD